MIRSISLIATLCLTLSGCLDTQTPAQTSRSAVGAGARLVDAKVAATLFGEICAKTLPRFAKTRSVLSRMPFQLHPKTRTYYHRKLDLSAKLISANGRKTCSMVFASKDMPIRLGTAVSISTASGMDTYTRIFVNTDTGRTDANLSGGARFTFRQINRRAGRRHYQAMIIAAK